MDLEKIKQKFREINKIFFKRKNQNNFLEIEVNLKTLNDITNLSKQISNYIDKNYLGITNSFILEVYSSGTDKILNIEELGNNLGKNILVKSKEKMVEGKLIDVNNKNIVVAENQKGQTKNIIFDKDKIEEIKLYVKVK